LHSPEGRESHCRCSQKAQAEDPRRNHPK
jgi:hypothetical protein